MLMKDDSIFYTADRAEWRAWLEEHFKTEKEIVVHRIIKKIETKDEVIYYTKGDANPKEDNYAIKRENIVGIVRFKVPFIGYPTIWLSEI